MKIVTPAQMKEMDRRTVEEGVCSSLALMGRAAGALLEPVCAALDARGEKSVLLLAGAGNNGGDAYALALLLQERAYAPVLLSVGPEQRSPDCAYYHDLCVERGIPFTDQPGDYPLVIDGVFGTGFHGALPPEVQALFAAVSAPVIAVDLPSGMDGESGVCAPGTLRPFLTVTFAFLKPCHLLADCGEVILKDIGIPGSYASGVTRAVLRPKLPPRSDWGHKNDFGSVGLLVGAPCYPGAAALALKGALNSGAGLVFGYLPELPRAAAAAKLYGPVLKSPAELLPLDCNAYLAGSGLGRSAEAAQFCAQLWQSDRPLVVDGDGLWLLRDQISRRAASAVLTPHMGEFARLIGKSVEDVRRGRLALAEEFAARNDLILVLKDAATVVTDGCRTAILSAPCSALAKGGSGDLLAGLTAGLLASGEAPWQAACTAVYLHNRAAHIAAETHSVRTLQPEQIADCLDSAWKELEHGEF